MSDEPSLAMVNSFLSPRILKALEEHEGMVLPPTVTADALTRAINAFAPYRLDPPRLDLTPLRSAGALVSRAEAKRARRRNRNKEKEQ